MPQDNHPLLPRRQALIGAGATGALLAAGRRARAAAQTVKIGFLSPVTGPLAAFGETDGFIVDLARRAMAGGLEVKGIDYKVELIDSDTRSDPVRAGQLAKSLISEAGVDLLLATSAPEVVNPVSDAAEAAGVPALSTAMPWEAWYYGRNARPGAPSPFKWTYHFSFGVADAARVYVSQWTGTVPTNRTVGVMYPNDADGNATREHLAPMLAKAGFTVVDPGPYEDGTSDYSAQIAVFKKNRCEIFNTFPRPPDFGVFWRQAARQGYTKMAKIVQIAKTGLVPSSVEALGALGYNLSSACYWHRDFPYKSALTGMTSRELANGYENSSDRQWTQQLGASLSLIEAGVAALQASGNPKDKAAVAKALGTLKTTTPVGKLDFTSGPVPNVCAMPLIGTQWVRGTGEHKFDYVITENAGDPRVPVAARLVPYA
jgi:branched-chain amino acid transport system substrate-binding protein